MSDQPEDQTPAPDSPEAGDSTPEPSTSGTPAPDFPEVEDSGPNPEVPAEPKSDVSAREDWESQDPGEPPAIGQGDLSESDDKTFGMLVHLLGAFTYIVGPIIIWMIKKEESPFVDDQGKEAVNWQIGVAIAMVVMMIASSIPVVGCITVPLMFGVGIANLILSILACVEANKGKAYRYPVNLRLIK